MNDEPRSATVIRTSFGEFLSVTADYEEVKRVVCNIRTPYDYHEFIVVTAEITMPVLLAIASVIALNPLPLANRQTTAEMKVEYDAHIKQQEEERE